MLSDRGARELFHFLFLQRLLQISRPELYVLKGGVNLRFFFQSPRYSEDMDIDVDPQKVSVETLQKNGYKVLEDGAFRRVLATSDITDLRINDRSRAKQTTTTQRFRLSLVLSSGQSFPTKIEFSRRGIASDVRIDRIDPEIARQYHRTAYACAHYSAPEMTRQKIRALADRPVTQARDMFDLYLLNSRGETDTHVVAGMDASVLERAVNNVTSLDFAAYEGQVLEYLHQDSWPEYGTRERFLAIQGAVLDVITRPRSSRL